MAFYPAILGFLRLRNEQVFSSIIPHFAVWKSTSYSVHSGGCNDRERHSGDEMPFGNALKMKIALEEPTHHIHITTPQRTFSAFRVPDVWRRRNGGCTGCGRGGESFDRKFI
jgi:hypothetical protein